MKSTKRQLSFCNVTCCERSGLNSLVVVEDLVTHELVFLTDKLECERDSVFILLCS